MTSATPGADDGGGRSRTPERLTLSVEEAANVLGISRAFAYELVARNELPVLRLGRRIVLPRKAVEAMVEQVSEIVLADRDCAARLVDTSGTADPAVGRDHSRGGPKQRRR